MAKQQDLDSLILTLAAELEKDGRPNMADLAAVDEARLALGRNTLGYYRPRPFPWLEQWGLAEYRGNDLSGPMSNYQTWHRDAAARGLVPATTWETQVAQDEVKNAAEQARQRERMLKRLAEESKLNTRPVVLPDVLVQAASVAVG